MKAQLNEVSFFDWFSLEDTFSNFRSLVDNTLSGSSVSFKVAMDGSSNAAAAPANKLDAKAPEAKDGKSPNEPTPSVLATEESVSEFISQVASLVK